MKKYTEELLSLFSSSTRCKIIEMLSEGYDHPDDLAEDLDLTRQAVDKHLLELHDWGLVERNAIFPPDGRPRIVYELTTECKQLTKTLDRISDRYRQTIIDRAEREIENLDDKLADGDLSEKIYNKKVEKVKERWGYEELKDEKH